MQQYFILTTTARLKKKSYMNYEVLLEQFLSEWYKSNQELFMQTSAKGFIQNCIILEQTIP